MYSKSNCESNLYRLERFGGTENVMPNVRICFICECSSICLGLTVKPQ